MHNAGDLQFKLNANILLINGLKYHLSVCRIAESLENEYQKSLIERECELEWKSEGEFAYMLRLESMVRINVTIDTAGYRPWLSNAFG